MMMINLALLRMGYGWVEDFTCVRDGYNVYSSDDILRN